MHETFNAVTNLNYEKKKLIIFRLDLGNFSFQSSSAVDQFKIQNYQLCSAKLNDKSIICAQFIIGRNIIGSMIIDFLPILISMSIGHLTNYVKLYEVAAGTNLTILLVLVTL
jgi:hypothetical protein